MTRWRFVPILLTVGLLVSTIAVPVITGAASPRASTGLPEFGVAVALDDTAPLSDVHEMAVAQQVFTYIAGLGADAVQIDFPFYMATQSASTVSSGIGTPSPAVLKGIIQIAQQHGLEVQLRPLMSEEVFDTPLTGAWRGSIVPTNITEWFQSYWSWLEPYVVVAKETDVASFAIGSELNSLISAGSTTSTTGEPTIGIHNFLGYWLVLSHEVQSIIGNRLLYAASHLQFDTVPGIGFGYDAYYPVTIPVGKPPVNSSTPTSTVVNEFTASMEASYGSAGFAATLQSTRLEEVGIAAVDGAWTQPNDYTYPPDTPIARWVQADWFTSMCDTFIHYDMAGIYFWSVDFNGFSPSYNADTEESLYNFEGTKSDQAIKACFTQIRDAH